MAHIDKFTKAATGHMLKHIDRDKDSSGKYVKFGNIDIDLEKTHLNYNLCQHKEGSKAFLDKRLEQVQKYKRADVKVMCSWVITAPKTLPEEKLEDFFQESYNFMANRYGKENVITAQVHLDEISPHMHFAFIPVVKQKDGTEKLKCKDLITRMELKKFHPELQEHLEKKLGCKVDVLTGITAEQGKNKSIRELKAETNKALDKLLNSLKNEFKALEKSIKSFDEEMEHPQLGMKKQELKDSTFGKKKEYIVVEDQEPLRHIFIKQKKLMKDLEEYKEYLNKAKESIMEALDYNPEEYRMKFLELKKRAQYLDDIENALDNAEYEIKELTAENKSLIDDKKELKNAISLNDMKWEKKLEEVKNKGEEKITQLKNDFGEEMYQEEVLIKRMGKYIAKLEDHLDMEHSEYAVLDKKEELEL